MEINRRFQQLEESGVKTKQENVQLSDGTKQNQTENNLNNVTTTIAARPPSGPHAQTPTHRTLPHPRVM